jgi:pyrroloquinoline-quinone synthase
MLKEQFFQELDARIAKYDLLCHPFYKAWAAGELEREDLRQYAANYYHHVEAFPSYLETLAGRLPEGEMRRAVLTNMEGEQGHSDLWLDFAESVGSSRDLSAHQPVPEIGELVCAFRQVAQEGAHGEALAAFYAYESQVPRVAGEKAHWLAEKYGADQRACQYFTLHATADIHHAQVWREQLGAAIASGPEVAETALVAGEAAARALWRALDGIEKERIAEVA